MDEITPVARRRLQVPTGPIPEPVPTKRCKTCRHSLPLTSFHSRTRGSMGVSAHCVTCTEQHYQSGMFGCSRCNRRLPGPAFPRGLSGSAVSQPCKECRSAAGKAAREIARIERGRAPYHLLSEIDELARTAICRECGPTPVFRTGAKGCGWRCGTRSAQVSAEWYDAKADIADKHAAKRWHRLRDVRLGEMRGMCSLCGDVPVRWSSSGSYFTCAGRAKKSEHAARTRRRRRLKLYGLTPDDYERMNRDQGGCCAICGGTDAGRSDSDAGLAVDHDHETGEVRALLCKPCNTGLGAFRDDPELMQAAIEYVRRYRDAHGS